MTEFKPTYVDIDCFRCGLPGVGGVSVGEIRLGACPNCGQEFLTKRRNYFAEQYQADSYFSAMNEISARTDREGSSSCASGAGEKL
jgi:DNA-directed RNA polymerase subunit RPC12/RpoP